MRGTNKAPTYKSVCLGQTGHAEVVQVTYDKTRISLTQLLEVFFESHDPTTLNRQGADIGSQYRSIILYRNEEQKQIVDQFVTFISKHYKSPIVTEIALSLNSMKQNNIIKIIFTTINQIDTAQ